MSKEMLLDDDEVETFIFAEDRHKTTIGSSREAVPLYRLLSGSEYVVDNTEDIKMVTRMTLRDLNSTAFEG